MATDLHEDLDRLVGSLCDGTLSAADCERLDALLRSDDEARRYYNDYMFACRASFAACVCREFAAATLAEHNPAYLRVPQSAIRNRVVGDC
jgi:hypothetical protein